MRTVGTMVVDKMDEQAYLRGYRYGASNVRALAGVVGWPSKSREYIHGEGVQLKLVSRDKTTRFALGKGRVKFVLTSAIDAFRYAGEIRPCDSYEAGYIDAFLDSVN